MGNRELKFRAFYNNRIIKSVSPIGGNCFGYFEREGNENVFKYSFNGYVMQFTGVTDADGIEIYEGDILKSHGIVSWNDVEHKWSCIDLNWNDRREWHCLDYLTSPMIIIGNIHENKDLLT